MSQTLRVLMVEDCEDDALIIQHALQAGGYAVQLRRVETEAALREALRDGQWDIVLSDYYLPSFNAEATLRTLRDTGHDLPVIIISGTVGEDVAVETLRLGADDYLLKQRLTRLVPAVARALAVAGDRRRQRQLERMQTIILENSPDLICSLDGNGRLLEVSAASRTVLGYEPAELECTPLEALVHPDDLPLARRIFLPALHGGRARDIECRLLHRSGLPVWITWSTAFSAADGMIVAIGRDVTERRHREQALRESERHLRQERDYLDAVIDSLPGVFYHFDENLRLLRWNRRSEQTSGYPADKLQGIAASAFIAEEDRERVAARIRDAMQYGQSQVEADYITSDGRRIPHLFTGMRFNHHGQAHLIGVGVDITERKHAEEALREETARFEALAESSPVGILVVDRRGKVVFQNRLLDRIWKLAEDVSATKDIAQRTAIVAQRTTDPAGFIARVAWLTERANEIGRDEIELTDGTIVERYSAPVFDREGNYYGRTWIHADITERRRAEQRLHYLANHDELTGLPSRNLILARITRAVAEAQDTDRQLALLYLDLDRFKVINDGYGHPFGDEVLKAAGRRLAGLVREGDTVARHGGDEFLILMTDLRRASDAYAVARKIVESLDEPLVVQDRLVHLSGSVGVSVFPQDGHTADELIGNADIAMYRAKSLGRNNFHFFTPGLSEETQLRIELETRLRGAAAAGQFEVLYQPKVDLDSGAITGCEALLRWQHPELGAVSPEQFIPIAEESGLIVPIGDWVLRTACRQARAWLDAGLPPIHMAVNVSARQFLQQDVKAWVLRTLKEARLPAGSLELELTESLIAQDAAKTIATVRELRTAGVRLSIDDFGTGYSSLNYLKRFQVDALKIDQSFVRNILTATEDATIVLTVISLAHSLGFKVIAEGVETAEQCGFLRLNRCDEIQGYYFSRAVPAAEFEAMLRDGVRLREAATA